MASLHSFPQAAGGPAAPPPPLSCCRPRHGFCCQCNFTFHTKCTERRGSSDSSKYVTSIPCPFPRLLRYLFTPCIRGKEQSFRWHKAIDSRGGVSGSWGCGAEQHMQLSVPAASCWELWAKDTTSPPNWNPQMDSLGQDRQSQEEKGRIYNSQSSSFSISSV